MKIQQASLSINNTTSTVESLQQEISQQELQVNNTTSTVESLQQ